MAFIYLSLFYRSLEEMGLGWDQGKKKMFEEIKVACKGFACSRILEELNQPRRKVLSYEEKSSGPAAAAWDPGQALTLASRKNVGVT